MKQGIPLFLVLILLQGCLFKEVDKPITSYIIETPFVSMKGEIKDKTVKFRVRQTPFFHSRDIWYKKSYQLAPYKYAKWAIPLDEMVAQNLSQAKFVRETFGQVLSQHSSLHSDYTFEIEILQMYQQFEEKGSLVKVRLGVTLLSHKSEAPIRRFVIDKSHPCKTDDALGAIGAYEEVFNEIQQTDFGLTMKGEK